MRRAIAHGDGASLVREPEPQAGCDGVGFVDCRVSRRISLARSAWTRQLMSSSHQGCTKGAQDLRLLSDTTEHWRDCTDWNCRPQRTRRTGGHQRHTNWILNPPIRMYVLVRIPPRARIYQDKCADWVGVSSQRGLVFPSRRGGRRCNGPPPSDLSARVRDEAQGRRRVEHRSHFRECDRSRRARGTRYHAGRLSRRVARQATSVPSSIHLA